MAQIDERRIQDVTQDHINWIRLQLEKNKFLHAKGRLVYIGQDENLIVKYVKIPDKVDQYYRKSWADVYNMAVEYLENELQEAGNKDNYDVILPKFDSETAQYARTLEMMIEEYKKYQIKEETKADIKVTERTILLNSVSETKLKEIYQKQNQITDTDKETIEKNNIDSNTNEYNKIDNLIIKKISDGELLGEMEFNNLKEETKFIILPCRNVDKIKEEKLYLDNAQKCEDEGIKFGTFLYGHSRDEVEASLELKRIIKLLENQCSNFIGFVMYEINDNYVLKNKDSEMKLLSFINAYTIVAEGLANANYMPMISMNLESRKILDDIYSRYSLKSKYEICYMVLAREIDKIEDGMSTILVDPQYDYDIITICDTPFKNNELLYNINEKSCLLKAA